MTLECTSTLSETLAAEEKPFHNEEAASIPTSDNAVDDSDNEESEISIANTVPVHNIMVEHINLDLVQHQEGLKTSAGNNIKHLLGCDADLVNFDDHRFKLKEAKRAGKDAQMTASISQYKELLAKIDTKIRLVESENAAKLQELEQRHFEQHGKLPAKTPGSEYYNILKKRKLARAVLAAL